ncbi:MAG: CPBP family intramembrane metalloprotease [Thiohalocapsa sp.]|nr:CPBP family intramembrane metalloprotease [Thiohalocapsa sp.]MCF7990444.1 CPBP family intramembrane metalloprotease [Thiohalocapsa sp.]
MQTPPGIEQACDVPFGALYPFLVITFAVTGAVFGAFFFLADWVAATFGEPSGHHPLFILAVYAPAIAAFIVVAYYSGSRGLRGFLSRILLWRCPAWWYAFLLLGIPLIFVGGSMLKGNWGVDPLPGLNATLAAMAFMLVLGPVEEFGWRGVALPLLQRRMAPIWAGLVLGLIWGLWHLPAFLLAGTPQSGWGFTPFLIGSVAVSLILTPMFNAAAGSILVAALFHYQLINPLWPDAQPYDILLFSLAAVVIVWLNRHAMFGRSGAATEVVRKAGRCSG